MCFGLDENIIAKIRNIFAHYPQIEKVILYGSRAKDTYKNGSDIDFSLIGDAIDLSIISKLQCDLDDLMLPYTFDISIFKQISNADLADQIIKTGVCFYP